MGPIIRKIRVLGSDRKSEMAGACPWPGFEEGVVSDMTVRPSNVYAIGTICPRTSKFNLIAVSTRIKLLRGCSAQIVPMA